MKKICFLILTVSLSFNMFATNSFSNNLKSSDKDPIIKTFEKKSKENSLISYKKSKMLNYFIPSVKLKNNKFHEKNRAFQNLCTITRGGVKAEVYQENGRWYVTYSHAHDGRPVLTDELDNFFAAVNHCIALDEFLPE